MANAKANEPKRVELFIHKGTDDNSPNFLISFNGVNYVIPKGKAVMVPEFVAKEYYRSRRAVDEQDDRKDEFKAQAQKKAKEYGLT